MSVLLATGLSGFLGRRCVEDLARRGFEIHGITSRDARGLPSCVRWHNLDLLKSNGIEALCASIRPDALFHLAWYAEHPEFWTSPLNLAWLRASRMLVDACVASGTSRIVAAGSCAEYATPARGRYAETSAVGPTTPYGAAKASLHEYVAEVGRSRRVTVAWGRLFFLYGPGEPETKFIPATAREFLLRRAPVIRDPDRYVDYIHVSDAARAFVRILDSPIQGAINVGTGRAASVSELARLIRETLAGETPTVPDESGRQFSGQDMVADVARLSDELSFGWKFDLQSGVRDELEAAS